MKTLHEDTHETEQFIQLKVAGRSTPSKIAGAIFNYMRDGRNVSLIAMGAGAVNQAVKAIAISRGLAAPYGWNLYCIPGFSDEYVNGIQKTAIVFEVLR